jgi:hypothetical protein
MFITGKYVFVVLIYFSILNNTFAQQQKKAHTIWGYVTENTSKESLPGVNLYEPTLKTGTTTNTYGFYSITVTDKDTLELIISYIGYKTRYIKIDITKDLQYDISLEKGTELNEIVVSDKKSERISDQIKMSSISIPIEQIKNLPALLGEKDVLKALQLLPGVQSGSEGSSGIYVRGGGPDQNLIILDDATVYNATHLFGFFSLFNGDALKSVELIKGGFPARYGGRLSSVIDMQMKDGNKEKMEVDASIGLISSRLTVEGPIKKNKASFLFSARRTYADLLLKPIMKHQQNNLSYFFYDMNAKLDYIINNKNKLYLSGYFGQDKFSNSDHFTNEFNEESISKSNINWGNSTATLRWNHIINEKIFSNTSLIFTNFLFDVGFQESSQRNVTKLNYFSGIRDYSIKTTIDYYLNQKHTIKCGVLATYHYFRPNAVASEGISSGDINKIVSINAIESSIYGEDSYTISEKWSLNAGIRLSNFNIRTKSYLYPEPRLLVKYNFLPGYSLKGSYVFMNQYLHLLSNSGIGLPSDLWVPATDRIAPQRSQQLALGVTKDLKVKEMDFLLSVEGYYKTSKNVIGYKEGASFLNVQNVNVNETNNFNYEDIVTSGNGESYGSEFLIQKKYGKLTGWLGYTLSWVWLKFDDLNGGKRYPAQYDRRNDISIAGTYELNDHISFSVVWVYGTGNAINLPIASYQLTPQPSPYTQEPSGSSIIHGYNINPYTTTIYDYGDKNSLRMPAYHRLDASIKFKRKKKRFERIIELGLYNAYNRHNPFYYKTVHDYKTNTTKLVEVSLFPIIPSVSIEFKF